MKKIEFSSEQKEKFKNTLKKNKALVLEPLYIIYHSDYTEVGFLFKGRIIEEVIFSIKPAEIMTEIVKRFKKPDKLKLLENLIKGVDNDTRNN